jgi:hypothetical protein
MKIKDKTVLKGDAWHHFLKENKLTSRLQIEIYYGTYNYQAIYLLNGYYFVFGIKRGYTNVSSLKGLITKLL